VTRERSSGPSHRRGFCCPVNSSGNTAASDSLPAGRPLPEDHPVIRRQHSDEHTAAPPGRGGSPQFPPPPSERSTPSTPGSSSELQFQDLRSFRGLRRDGLGSALPIPHPKAGTLTARQASLDAADRSVAPPKGLSTLGFDPTRFQTEPPACYRASWQLPGPDSHPQATTSLCQISYSTSTSNAGRTPRNCVVRMHAGVHPVG
jgi:hypothetical protein